MTIPLAKTSKWPNPDFDLTSRIAAGDEEALRELYAAYGRRLYAYALRLTGTPGMAEDVMQESLLAVWKGAGGYRGEGRLISWLLGIVHHQAMNTMRRKQLPLVTLEAARQAVSEVPQAIQMVEGQLQREALTAGIRRLPSEQRIALELVFFQGLSLTEVAQVCGCPVGTIKSRLNAAKTALRHILASMGVQAGDIL